MRHDLREGLLSPSGNLGEDLLQIAGMMENSAALIAIYDETEQLMYCNYAFRQTFGVQQNDHPTWQELIRRNFEAEQGIVIQSDNIDAWIASTRAEKGKSRVRSYEMGLHSGSFLWAVETTLDNDWIIFVGTDVTRLNEPERILRISRDTAVRASSTDELTGISNRRHILGRLKDILDPETAGAVNFGVACLIDIDFFKSINDRFGHHVGDEVLTSFTSIISNIISLQESFGRVGGEEFLILFPRQTRAEVRRKMERIRSCIAEQCRIDVSADTTITFSGGLSSFCAGDSVNGVLKRCDQALYAAKNNGRDRVCVAPRQPKDHLQKDMEPSDLGSGRRALRS